MKIKIAVGIIIYNSDFVLKQAIESVYPYASQILVSEGCVKYWADQGITTSSDRTNEILAAFPDPENKIKIIHGTYPEKTDQANAYMQHVAPDTDYIWNLDADEIFKPHDIEKIIHLLETEKYTSVGFKSITFYGGFDRYLTGFEQEYEFLRIRKFYPGAIWENHRPPTVKIPSAVTEWPAKHLSFEVLASKGIFMYHYSYVFPRQVKEKIAYYEAAVIKKDGCIPDYFRSVYGAWVLGDDDEKQRIEAKYKGVHEFVPKDRGECYTAKFTGSHPFVITRDKNELDQRYNNQLKTLLSK